MPDLPQDNEKVRIARVKSADNVYYAFFNQEPKAKKISFRMDDELVVYREGFKLVPKAGQITLQLRPYEVIICGKSPLPAPANKTIPCNPELEDLRDPVYDYIRSHSGIVEDLFAANYYRGKANWIWNKEQLSQAGSSCVLVKRFTLDTIPAGAELLFCADDEADAYLNGKFVGKGDEHGRLWRYDVRNMLKTGENILVINARDGGGLPCAMLAEFRGDGKVLFVSDEKWEAKAAESGENFLSTELNGKLGPAFITAPYGKGPWGRILLPDGK
jgi:hypothetical protein